MRILAVDYGTARTGLAVCDVLETIATPLVSVPSRNEEKLLAEIARVVKERQIEKIILGCPRRTDGAVSEMEEKAVRFAGLLHECTGLCPELVDERYTTVIASQRLHENDRRAREQRSVIDAAAAAVLLEDYLRRRKT